MHNLIAVFDRKRGLVLKATRTSQSFIGRVVHGVAPDICLTGPNSFDYRQNITSAFGLFAPIMARPGMPVLELSGSDSRVESQRL
ncbi:hypothetical protein V6N12_029604 [Hibiscus sabdariffa]|uniref:Uncharacterized protein n=1 Tax=Hibiscus sabdariffa TaxID=183260 RepID=A0ABR2CWL6_9ROSI